VDLGPAGQRSFVPHTALAESLSIPGDHNELRLLLAEGKAACERHITPEPGQVLLHVTVIVPDKATIGPGTYAWVPPPEPKNNEPPPVTARAVPKVHVGATSHLLRPGGGVQLTKVDLDPNGSVEGLLAFEFPGDGKSPATRVQGRFSARICNPGGGNGR